MSAPENRARALKGHKKRSHGRRKGPDSERKRIKSHYLKKNLLLRLLAVSYADHP